MKKIIVGLTGASGSPYFADLVDNLLSYCDEICLVASEPGEKVFFHEMGKPLEAYLSVWQEKNPGLYREANNNLFGRAASGTGGYEAMVIAPCSMTTLGRLAAGISDSLLTRAADVMIKEGRKLVLLPRETPLSAIHLENMLKLSRLGVSILPAMPAFYQHPCTLEELVHFVTGKTLENLGIAHDLYQKWGGV